MNGADRSRREQRAARLQLNELIDEAEAEVLASSLRYLAASSAADAHHEDWQHACDNVRKYDAERDAAVRKLRALRASKASP